MGIDIYLQWKGQTDEEKQSQYTGFSIDAGHTGYLREAYHGGPYATHILVREAFESESCRAQIPAAVMRERLTSVTEPAQGYDDGSKAAELIYELMRAARGDEARCDGAAQPFTTHRTDPQTVEECIRARCALVYRGMPPGEVEEYVKSFRDFVALAEQKEAETGEPCTVYASY